MTTLKAFRYRLKPNDEQIERLYRMAGCGRVVYNQTLEMLLAIAGAEMGFVGDRKALYARLNAMAPAERIALAQSFPGSAALNKLLTAWKKNPDLAFLKAAYTDNLQQRQRDLRDRAIKDWCTGKRGFPVFRTRRIARHSTLRFVNFSKYCSLEGRHLTLPNQLGRVRFYRSRSIQGEPRSCTVSLDACGRWHVSILCAVEIEPVHTGTGAVGLDMGIVQQMCLSNGTIFQGITGVEARRAKLVKAQQRLSRRVRGSANWKKQKRKIAKLHQRETDIRRDYQHKATTAISKTHAMVVVEDLNIANMSRSAKGTLEQPGKHVRQKSGLNRAILAKGWGETRRQLAYKTAWNGGCLVVVPPHYTSQTCPVCGHVATDNRTTQAKFLCVECGYTENADRVGAINVLNRGLAAQTRAA